MRFLFPLLLLLAVSPLDAAFYSNALGMDLGPKAVLDGDGYEGEVRGDTTVIYKDGETVLVRIESSDGYALKEPGREEIVVVDSGGRRLSRTVVEDGHRERTVYDYDGERLSSVTLSTDDGIQSRIEYIDTADGLLAGLAGDSISLLGQSFYLYELEDGLVKVSFHGDGSIGSEEISGYRVEDDGSWVSDNASLDSEGNLVSREEDGKSEEYGYSQDGKLVSIRTRKGNAEVLTLYDDDGDAVLEEHYIDGVIVRSYDRTDPDAVTETRYEDGVAAFRISYDGDGKRIRRVDKLR